MRDALDSAIVAIGASGSASARLDAELLLAHALGISRAQLVIDGGREIEGAQAHSNRIFATFSQRRGMVNLKKRSSVRPSDKWSAFLASFTKSCTKL